MFYTAVLILLLSTQISLPKPIDSNAAKAFKGIEGIFKQPLSQRKLTKEQTELFNKRAETETDNRDMLVCASIALAYAEDSNSFALLKKLTSEQNELVKGASLYALKVRQISERKPNDINNFYRCDLFYYLSQSDNPEILKEALKLDWRQDVLISLPESLSFIMGSITPDRTKDDIGNSAIEIIENI